MKREKIVLYQENEYEQIRHSFIPTLHAYLHQDENIHPAIIVVPGGGYMQVSASEAYLVAKPYFDAGYQAYVLTYTTNTYGLFEPIGMQPLKDISRAICEVRSRANEDRVAVNQVAVVGFSAGGHLAASLAVHYENKEVKLIRDKEVSNRPDAVILAYPVITTKNSAHRPSFVALYGTEATEQELEFASVELHVTKKTPPTFLWHTMNDPVVPVENSIAYLTECRKRRVFAEAHFYPNGRHGFSVANPEWLKNQIGDACYTYAQMKLDFEYLEKNHPEKIRNSGMLVKGNITEMDLETFAEKFLYGDGTPRKEVEDKTIRNWVGESIAFLEKVWTK